MFQVITYASSKALGVGDYLGAGNRRTSCRAEGRCIVAQSRTRNKGTLLLESTIAHTVSSGALGPLLGSLREAFSWMSLILCVESVGSAVIIASLPPFPSCTTIASLVIPHPRVRA